MKPKLVFNVIIFSLLAAACSGAVEPPTTSEVTIAEESFVLVHDQDANEGKVMIEDVQISQAGWLVIHVSDGGVLGEVIGFSAVNAGENHDILVEIDLEKATLQLIASLYLDAGVIGTYEFSGADIPLKNGDSHIRTPFNITFTDQAAVEESADTPTEGYSDPTY